MMLDLLTKLYLSTTFIVAISFIPQLITLAKDRSGALSVNLITVSMWAFTSSVTFIYSLAVNGDKNFVIFSFFNALGCCSICFMTIWCRFFRKRA